MEAGRRARSPHHAAGAVRHRHLPTPPPKKAVRIPAIKRGQACSIKSLPTTGPCRCTSTTFPTVSSLETAWRLLVPIIQVRFRRRAHSTELILQKFHSSQECRSYTRGAVSTGTSRESLRSIRLKRINSHSILRAPDSTHGHPWKGKQWPRRGLSAEPTSIQRTFTSPNIEETTRRFFRIRRRSRCLQTYSVKRNRRERFTGNTGNSLK